MKKYFKTFSWLLALLLISMFALSGCGKKETTKKISCETDLNNPEFKLAGATGSVSLEVGRQQFPKATFVEYRDGGSMYLALQAGKIDAIVFDRPPLEYVLLSRDDFMIMPNNVGRVFIAMGAPFSRKALMDRINGYVRQYKSDGTYADMYNRWVNTKNPVMPDIPKAKNPQGKIKIGVECQTMPFNFIDSTGNLSGFDMELIKRMTLALNLDYELMLMEYDALFTACTSEKIDLAVASMDATPERRETMLFSENHIDCPVSVMIRKTDYAGTVKGGEDKKSSAGW